MVGSHNDRQQPPSSSSSSDLPTTRRQHCKLGRSGTMCASRSSPAAALSLSSAKTRSNHNEDSGNETGKKELQAGGESREIWPPPLLQVQRDNKRGRKARTGQTREQPQHNHHYHHQVSFKKLEDTQLQLGKRHATDRARGRRSSSFMDMEHSDYQHKRCAKASLNLAASKEEDFSHNNTDCSNFKHLEAESTAIGDANMPCSQISNPFEVDIESKIEHFTTDNSMLLKLSNSAQNEDSDVFQYSIDEMAVIKPINITQGEIEQSLNACNDYTNNVKVQNAISKFFKNNIIVPSPIDVNKKACDSKMRDSLKYIDPKISKIRDSVCEVNDKKSNYIDSSTQTDISLPFDYDLEEFLAKNLIQDPKLFNHMNGLFNMSGDSGCKSMNESRTFSVDSNSARKLFSPEPIQQNSDASVDINLGLNMFSPPPINNVNCASGDLNAEKNPNMNIFFSPPNISGFGPNSTRPQATPTTGEKIRLSLKSPILSPFLQKNFIQKSRTKSNLLKNIQALIHQNINNNSDNCSNSKFLQKNSRIECRSCNSIDFNIKCNSCGNSISLNAECSPDNNLSDSFINNMKQVMISSCDGCNNKENCVPDESENIEKYHYDSSF